MEFNRAILSIYNSSSIGYEIDNIVRLSIGTPMRGIRMAANLRNKFKLNKKLKICNFFFFLYNFETILQQTKPFRLLCTKMQLQKVLIKPG